jgi:hypothetical protein
MALKATLQTLAFAGLAAASTYSLRGQSTLSQVIPYSFEKFATDTAYVYENGYANFLPYVHTGAYFTPQYTLPNPRLGVGIQNLVHGNSNWFLQTNIEFLGTFNANRSYNGIWETYPFSLNAISEAATFAGSTVYSSIYKRKLKIRKTTFTVGVTSKGNTSTHYLVWHEAAVDKYRTWRLGLTQNQNTAGRYYYFETDNHLLGFRYQALRVGVGRASAEGMAFKLRKSDPKSRQASISMVYADLLIPFAHQNVYTGLLNAGDAKNVRYLPGFELGTSSNRSEKGPRGRNGYTQFVLGMHPVQYLNEFSFYTGLRINLFSTSSLGGGSKS